MTVTNMSRYIKYEMHRFDEANGDVFYQLMEIDGEHFVYVHGPNAKQTAYKLLRKLNEVQK